MKVSDYIAAFLYTKGVRTVFELSGGMIAHMLDSLYMHGGITIVSMRHEQAAAFAADACGRMTGIPGVAMATSGPGAVNLLTGIGSCYFDSSPALFITGQVNRNEQRGDRNIRQLGFQETDVVGMAGPITKAAWRITHAEEVPEKLERAFHLAQEGRPGPVLLDIPLDVQRAEIDSPGDPEPPSGSRTCAAAASQSTWDALMQAQRPLLLIGGGIRAAGAVELLAGLLEKLPVPVVHSLMAVDVLPYRSPCRQGMIGTYGNRWCNLGVGLSDLLIVLGSRLDVRQTGSQTELFKAQRRIIHVDCEKGELNNRIKGCDIVHSELLPFLQDLLENRPPLTEAFLSRLAAWNCELSELRTTWPDTRELENLTGINPNTFMHQLSRCSGAASAYVVDVGQHQMWAAQSLELQAGQRFLTSGGMGAMGFALPAAIGTAFSVPGLPVVVIAGDGGFQCNIQELQTVVHHGLPIKIVVINNGCHGMVRQFQESYLEKRYQSTYWGYSAPHFPAIARAYGIEANTLTDPAQAATALGDLWADPMKPALLEVKIETFANVYPKIAFGQPLSVMEPSQPVDVG
jgi:acetolactate synthase I/II/III large subunit